MIPDEEILITTRWMACVVVGVTVCSCVISLMIQWGRPDRVLCDVRLGDTFTYQLGMTVVLVRELCHSHVSKNLQQGTEILQSHLTQRDVQPATSPLLLNETPSHVTRLSTVLHGHVVMRMSKCQTTLKRRRHCILHVEQTACSKSVLSKL